MVRYKSLKSLFVTAAIIALSPLTSYADEASAKIDDAFKAACIKTWMEHGDKSSDKVGYKNFGEKYCDCAASMPLNDDAAMNKSVQICLSRSLLHDTMDNIESDQGLSGLTEDAIKTGCASEVAVIYPDIDAAANKGFVDYCACAAPKLMAINNDRDNMTDKDWYSKINGAAADCAGKITPDKGTVAAKKH